MPLAGSSSTNHGGYAGWSVPKVKFPPDSVDSEPLSHCGPDKPVAARFLIGRRAARENEQAGGREGSIIEVIRMRGIIAHRAATPDIGSGSMSDGVRYHHSVLMAGR